MSVLERLWFIFGDIDMKKNPSYWTFCGTPLLEYIERAEWIDENIIGAVEIKIVANIDNVFIFENNDEAMAFKLRWI